VDHANVRPDCLLWPLSEIAAIRIPFRMYANVAGVVGKTEWIAQIAEAPTGVVSKRPLGVTCKMSNHAAIIFYELYLIEGYGFV